MKYFIVCLVVAVVFADPRVETSFEDSQLEMDKSFEVNQQEMEGANMEDDNSDNSESAVIPTSTHLEKLINFVVDKKLTSQPGRSKTIHSYWSILHTHNVNGSFYLRSCADGLSLHWCW